MNWLGLEPWAILSTEERHDVPEATRSAATSENEACPFLHQPMPKAAMNVDLSDSINWPLVGGQWAERATGARSRANHVTRFWRVGRRGGRMLLASCAMATVGPPRMAAHFAVVFDRSPRSIVASTSTAWAAW